jgi:Glycosyl transferase family 2
VNQEQPHASARDVTACIPTVSEPDDVVRTVERLFVGRAYPSTILVSAASADEVLRSTLHQALEGLQTPGRAECRLLSPPPSGSATGNRNWLARHVETPLVLFADDDVDVHPDFLCDALASLDQGRADIVVAASTRMGGSGWFTTRGHFRPVEPGDPIAVGLACSLWRTGLFRSLWLDERIEYGYCDAEVTLRLYRLGTAMVRQSPYDFVHRGDDEPWDEWKDRHAERARGYVSVRRYAESRGSLVRFLLLEMLCNAVRRRRLLPRGQVDRQWLSVANYLLGGATPPWVRPELPPVAVEEPTESRELDASVIIPTRGRRDDLARCLEALRRQRTARPYEVVVVDDSSVPALTPDDTAPAILLAGAGAGPAAARNAGIGHARGAFVLFTDDDAIPDPDWVEKACCFLEENPDHVGVGGRTVSPPFDYLYERSVECDGPAFWTCNVAYRREVLNKLGGFDERFRAAHCEDLDLGYRALELGPVGFEPDMQVVHPPRPVPLREHIRRGRLASAEALLYSRHPRRYPVPRWLPRRGLAVVGVPRHWAEAISTEGLALVGSPRRLGRLLAAAIGQSLVAAYTVLCTPSSRRGPA